jgi:hypothetical protein
VRRNQSASRSHDVRVMPAGRRLRARHPGTSTSPDAAAVRTDVGSAPALSRSATPRARRPTRQPGARKTHR